MNTALANQPAQPPILWGRHRFHEIARWMLVTMPHEKHYFYLMRGRLPGDERDVYRTASTPCQRFIAGFNAYLYINRLVLRARKFLEFHPEQAPSQPFLHWWQCGIEQTGEQFFFISKSVAHGNYWNASNIWELCPKSGNSVPALAGMLDTAEQRHLLCFMLALYSPFQALALAKNLDVDMEKTRDLQPETRQLIFNLLATFHTF